MRPTRFSMRRAAVTLAAGSVAVGTMLAATAAQAAPAPASPDAAMALSQQLGNRSAGAYQDASGRMVVTVTDQAAALQVRAAGATPKMVTRGAADLEKITDALEQSAKIAGTAWAVDPTTNQVVVSVDDTITGAKLAAVQHVTDRFGSAVRIEHMRGTLSTTITGGEAIYTGSARCSLGFNVYGGGTYYFLTAGHCTNAGSYWYANGGSTYIGPTVGSSFPGNDYGIVRYDSSISHPGYVYLYNGSYRDITGAGNAYTGEYVYRSGSTTGVHGGSVTATNATVNYSQGTVYGLIQTTVCAEPGDSGGSLFAGNTALGMTSGGSGDCTYGGTTFFQPVTEALSRYGVNVY